jgi:hypothetical protein
MQTNTSDPTRPSPEQADASFHHTYKAIIRLYNIKLKRFKSIRSLANAETQLSVNAFKHYLLAIGGAFFIGFNVFIILNLLLGVLFNSLFGSLLIALGLLAICNLALLAICVGYAKKMRKLIGIRRTLALIKE